MRLASAGSGGLSGRARADSHAAFRQGRHLGGHRQCRAWLENPDRRPHARWRLRGGGELAADRSIQHHRESQQNHGDLGIGGNSEGAGYHERDQRRPQPERHVSNFDGVRVQTSREPRNRRQSSNRPEEHGGGKKSSPGCPFRSIPGSTYCGFHATCRGALPGLGQKCSRRPRTCPPQHPKSDWSLLIEDS